MRTKETERENFIRRVVTASPIPKAKAFQLAFELASLANESKRIATADCNRELTAREDKRDAFLDSEVTRIGKALKLFSYRQNDPRGWTIRVDVGPELADSGDNLSTGIG